MISYFTHTFGQDIATGYGYAGQNIVKSLQNLGIRVIYNSPEPPVQLNFTQPLEYRLNPNQYAIGYTPWESTGMQRGWVPIMNRMDEIWTTSPLIASWFKEAGVEVPLSVYEHGIEHIWKPFKRVRGEITRFLHLGEPAPRKCGQMVVDAFIDLFGDNPNYRLTIKASGYNTTRCNPVTGVHGPPNNFYKNINVITDTYDIKKLISLYYSHHILIYPSYGEGFGFIPLQGMATGMPVIFNSSWAPYSRFSAGLDIKDRLVESPWPDIHPGRMLEPSIDSLKEQMLIAASNFEDYSERAFRLAPLIHEEYDWERVTSQAFERFFEKII